MEVTEIADFARNFSTMIRVKGPDPKGLKMRNHAFHHHNSGTTTISASGMLLPHHLLHACMLTNQDSSDAVVVSVASIIEPFVAVKSRDSNVVLPELIPLAQIDVMLEGKRCMKQSVEGDDNHDAQWFPAKILRFVDVPASSLAIKLLMEASSPAGDTSWEVGWSLGLKMHHPQAVNIMQSQKNNDFLSSIKGRMPGRVSQQSDLMGKAITRIVFLLVPDILKKDLPEITTSHTCNRGDLLAALGSPFGILSPVHFFNSVSAGFISNCYPPTSYEKSLLMVDMHCLPGMEGAPIFGKQSNLIGLLTRPLRQNEGAEIQLVIPWIAIEAACRDSCQLVGQNHSKEVKFIQNNFHSTSTGAMQDSNRFMPATSIPKQLTSCSASSLVEQAKASICLITVGNGVWASGIILNSDGLILTNAHLVEPWRFDGTAASSGYDENKAKEPIIFLKNSTTTRDDRASEYYEPEILRLDTTSLDHLCNGHESYTNSREVGQISVRLDHVDPWIWCAAKVLYVCQGTLDISLLMLESFPSQLRPINVDLSSPVQGSKAFVIGHGLLGPRCGLNPSVSSGVIAHVVKSKVPSTSLTPSADILCKELPAMIQTTASVHPGSSGGAVLNSEGCMVGLVTSNAKHGGQTMIPHMNFSIPCAAMEPIFKFATDMKNTSLLHELDKPNKSLSSVWSMMPPLSEGPSDPGVHDLLKKNKHGKGSRFAKFMAEKEELFNKSNQKKTTRRLPLDTVPSKL